jgi:hypothetical protein
MLYVELRSLGGDVCSTCRSSWSRSVNSSIKTHGGIPAGNIRNGDEEN